MHLFFSVTCLLAWSLGASVLIAQEPVLLGASIELPESVAGELIVSELGCAACHGGEVDFKKGPDLSQVGARVQASYLRDYIARPHLKKPGTTMPDLLAGYSEEEKDEVAGALVDFLLGEQKEPLVLQKIDEEAAVRGEALFQEVGCAACHDSQEQGLANSAPLIALSEKYSVLSLTSFLEDPLKVRPDGRMPNMWLTHWEAEDLANYLLKGQKQPAADKEPEKPLNRAEEGRKFFSDLGCAQCHEPAAARIDFAKSFDTLSLEQNCSKAHYSLSDKQQKLLGSFSQKKEEPKLEHSIALKMAQHNCYACHSRDGLGGVSPERDAFFTTTNLNLGEQARIPPHLTGVGAKLKPAALRRVLLSKGSVRPYMNTRMPRFGSANVEELVAWLGQADKQEPLAITHIEDRGLASKTGHELVGVKGLGCNSCHTFFAEKSTSLNGLDLTVMWERLEEDWFHRYLLNPQEFNGDTIMPSFWPNGKSVRPEILDGDAEKQIDAIWQYLSKGQEARRPAGVRREPIAYGPEGDEAVMLRRQYTGIGKRGVGVGYPSGINLIFDAGKMSLGAIWKGDFAEMSPVWRGQGSGFVKEAGEGLVRLPAGPGLAKLESPDAKWPFVAEGENAPDLQLLGYSLDEKRRPTFRYQFEEIQVEDYFLDFAEGPKLRRKISFSKEVPEDFYFRLAWTEESGSLEKTESGWKLSEELFFSSSAPVSVVKVGEGEEELRVSLAGLRTLTLIYQYTDL